MKEKERDSFSPASPPKSLQDPAYQPTVWSSPVVGRRDRSPYFPPVAVPVGWGGGLVGSPLPTLSVLPGHLFP